ncbi:hypothetical protein C0993_011373, partial [Termitomyces sp. T159_Od127]
CDKCWADNNPEGCWYLVGTPLCFQCMAIKRPCTLDSAKMCEQKNTSNSMVERTYHQAVLVRRAQAVVEKAREVEAQSEAISLSKKSLALLMCQYNKEKGSSKGKRKASLPLSPTEKGKKRARVVSPVAMTLEVELEEDEEDEACCLATAIEASKAAPEGDDLAGPSHQAEVLQDVGNQQEDMEQEEEAEVGPEMTPQAHPLGEELP